jgi:hypothetical protein
MIESRGRNSKPAVGNQGLHVLVAKTRALSHANAGKTKSGEIASEATIRSTTEVLVACVTRIWHLGYHIQSPRSLKSSHVDALVLSWIEAGYGYATMKNALSRLRLMGSWLGKDSLVSNRAQLQMLQSRPQPHKKA